MDESPDILQAFESFLATLRRNDSLSDIKSFEQDLFGRLNPSEHLHLLYFEQRRWLDFEEFLQYYLEQFGDQILAQFGYASLVDITPGFRARLYRTQFGFLTEYHAYLLFQKVLGSENLYRSVALDKQGIDFQLRLDGLIFNIHIFIDNERAWSYRRYKSANKQVDALAGVHVNLPYSLQQGRFNSVLFLANGFGVYREPYVDYLLEEIKKGAITNNNIIGTTATGFVYR
ncbi:MAG: TaqI family restriction endonuclease [Bacteroidetes bacterium]|nr:TaqI family restriction endonuclease [Bacteroidota bacterium]